ncbi:MAG TPA: cupredoxin domain-containing protein [Methylophaga aminisulfidivorans]|uniref:Cupredoxin domain-containing protein n=2 Tax=root TaxID=1 RepID=A0A7C1VPN7_9GAMM|nr:cupredoxin domain-containing protein [Methylophaga aminisulfidivorans]HEC74566.1 cupredoxin domain-containing protein [Methylophaga aminisulfidivorans]
MRNICLIIFLLLPFLSAQADTMVVEVRIKDHLFFPDEIRIPADTKVKLLIKNEDVTAEEFESYELNREKVIAGGSQAIVFIGPLSIGVYPFFGEFFPKTAQGKVIVE